MSNPKIITGIIYLLFIITSCNERPEPLNDQFSDKNQFQVKGNTIPVNNKKYGDPLGMELMDSLLFYKDNFNKKHFSVLDIKNKKMLRRFGKEGRGPNEVPLTTTLRVNKRKKQIEFSTLNTHEFFNIPITEIIENHKGPLKNNKKFDYPFENKELHLKRITSFNYRYIASGLIKGGKFALLNNEGKIDTIIGDYFVAKKHSYLTDIQKADAYQGDFVKHPSKQMILYYGLDRDFLEILSASDNKFKVKRKLSSYYPEIKIFDNRIALNGEAPLAFQDVATTSDFIYALFSGRNFKEYGTNAAKAKKVYIFDWNLNPVCSYILEYDTRSIAVSENNEEMYAFGITKDNEMELMKYELKHQTHE